MKFTFSIRTALKDSWRLFTNHWGFFVVMASVMIVFSTFSHAHHTHRPLDIALTVVVVLASVVWGYVWMSSCLAAVDGKEDILNLRSLSIHMPTGRQFLMLIAVGIVAGFIIAVGFILLIIPGFYFLIRLAFASTAYVDRQAGVKASLEYSWHLVKGKIFWTVFLVLIVQVALMIVGAITVIGSLITYPLALLLMMHLYRALTIHHRQSLTTETVETI
jgi:uncharacterized membrane protein